jgi:hypothetical protein
MWPPRWQRFIIPVYEVPARGLIADGSEAVELFLIGFLGAFPDLWLQKLALYHADDAVIVECKFGGTNRGPLGVNGGAGCLDLRVR